MTEASIATYTRHATLVFERTISAKPHEVFAAFANFEMRAAWSAPSETAVLIYDGADFRQGGMDRFRCGAKANPNIDGTTHYHVIDPGRLIVTAETIDMDGQRLCTALNTIEFAAEGLNTRLKHTVQIASFSGEEMIKGHTDGNTAALDNLVRHFAKP